MSIGSRRGLRIFFYRGIWYKDEGKRETGKMEPDLLIPFYVLDLGMGKG